MLKRVANKIAKSFGRIPNLDGSDTALPYLNGIYEQLMRKGRGELRPTYTWAMVQSTFLASSLDVKRISALEFGVAGGNGLLALERVAERIEKYFPVTVDVYGFDSAQGLPKALDHRDLPNLWPEAGYPMDVQKLRGHLKRAELVVGLVEKTVGQFLESKPAPIGFVSFDLDFYSSTVQAFGVLQADYQFLMPRVHCYFDDILGYTCAHHNGERLAISEFNSAHATRQISQIYGLRFCLPRRDREANWTEKMFMAHLVEHPSYDRWDGLLRRAQLDLAAA